MQLPRMTTRRWLLAAAVAAVIAAGIDWSVIGVALLILIRAARRPQPVHRTTAILLTLLTGILLWANLRPSGWQEEFGGESPPELDAITRTMFWRGWPLSPCMFCLMHGMRFHPSGIERCVLIFDGVLFLVALFAAKAVCESCLRWLQHRNV
jgi:uncharacterized membrane protein HdeD (DUF308 family)